MHKFAKSLLKSFPAFQDLQFDTKQDHMKQKLQNEFYLTDFVEIKGQDRHTHTQRQTDAQTGLVSG